jgi:hypothetical protein
MAKKTDATLEDLKTKISNATTVEDSAKQLIDGFGQRLSDAVAQAQANGATPEELAPVTDLATALQTESDALQASVVANTPAANA